MLIAIDGPSASGKGTIARRLAAHFKVPHLDTGLLYRAVALAVLRQKKNIHDEAAALEAAQALKTALQAVHQPRFSDSELRSEDVGQAASTIAAMPAVRQQLLAIQKDFAAQPGGAILDGRDIGTVIAPEADIKIFITAGIEQRAQRRMKELQEHGQNPSYEVILNDLRVRDTRDTQRAIAPTKPAPDAALLDTSAMNADEAFAAALVIAMNKTKYKAN